MAIITGADLAGYLGIDDSEDDDLLGMFAAAACEAVIEYCGRSFERVETDDVSARYFWPTEQCSVVVDDFWSTTGLVVQLDNGDDGTYETTWTITDDFFLEPINGLVNGEIRPYDRIVATPDNLIPVWGRRPAVKVTAAWGWAAVPSKVKNAALIRGAALYARKDSPSGVLGGFADFSAIRVPMRLDPDFELNLRNYRSRRKVRIR